MFSQQKEVSENASTSNGSYMKQLSQEDDDDFNSKSTINCENEKKFVFEKKMKSRIGLNEKQIGRNRKDRERQKIMKSLLSDGFIDKHRNGNMDDVKKELRNELREGEVIRKKEYREMMHGTDCKCCSGYYDALDLSPDSRKKRIQEVSKHKYINNPMPTTPEHYWDIGFPSDSEQKRRGLIKFSSPKKNICKKLF